MKFRKKNLVIKIILSLAFTIVSMLGQSTAPIGAVNPDVTQENIHKTICVSGWTKTIRPPASYTNKLKRQQMVSRGLTGKPGDYEEDHLISLELGGHPSSPDNLWPEPYAAPHGAREKDQVEDALHRLVCAGKLPLVEAQTCIRLDWVKCGVKIGVK